MSTFPYSKLPAEIKARHDGYKGSSFVTWVKVTPYMIRFNISLSTERDIAMMLSEGWKVIKRGRLSAMTVIGGRYIQSRLA